MTAVTTLIHPVVRLLHRFRYTVITKALEALEIIQYEPFPPLLHAGLSV
jgi:hypothetical protein